MTICYFRIEIYWIKHDIETLGNTKGTGIFAHVVSHKKQFNISGLVVSSRCCTKEFTFTGCCGQVLSCHLLSIQIQSHRIHVGNSCIHFPLNVTIFHLMQVNHPYMEPMGMTALMWGRWSKERQAKALLTQLIPKLNNENTHLKLKTRWWFQPSWKTLVKSDHVPR